MSRSAVVASPLATAALALVRDAATAGDLDARFAASGADLRPGVAGALLAELASLGLVHVAHAGAGGAAYALTSLGEQMVERGLAGDVAVRLQELEGLRTDLLSTIAHELRTPLTAVRTSAGLLIDEASSPTEAQRRAMVETIGRNADRMQRLVGDILDLARFRSGAIRLQLRRFDAGALARDAVAAVAPLADRGQRLEVVAPASGPMVFGDHRRLEQALVNLLSNAMRFSPDGGRVEVTVGADGERIRWTVADEGAGIPAADRARLFERFFVGRGDRSGPREGVGLGLPTALAIAQAHGGSIDVRSEAGQGSAFSLVVPAAGPPGAEP